MAGSPNSGALGRIIRNAGRLGSTKVIGALFGILALSFAGRAMGVHAFGVMMLVHTMALGANAICGFQSWQTVVRYGTPAIARGDRNAAIDAVRLSFGLDIAGGLFGMVSAMLLLPIFAGRFGITGDLLPYAIAYCTVIPGMASATPTGVLRMFDRFDLMAIQQPITSMVRAVTTFAAWRLHAGLPAFLLAWYAGNIAGDGFNWMLCVRELRRHGMSGGLTPGLGGPASRLPGSWRFAWTTNLSTTISAGWGSIGNLILGALLGPSAAGVYKIACSLLDAAGRPADLMARSLYPEIMRQDPRTDAPWRLCMRAGAIAGIIGVLTSTVVFIGGRPLIAIAFGPRYAPADGILGIMTVALAVSMATFPLQSLLYMAGKAGSSLMAEAVATAAYLSALAILSLRFGLTGSAWAYVLGTTLASIMMLVAAIGTRRRMLDEGRRERAAGNGYPIDSPDGMSGLGGAEKATDAKRDGRDAPQQENAR